MTTALSTCLTLLSKDLGDYWSGTTTSGGSSTTVVDTALKAKANDWISDAPQEMYDRITSGTYDGEERKLSSLDNSSGTLTTLAHGGTIASGVTYEVHRLFSASEKRRALIHAATTIFPTCFKEIHSTSKTLGNWLLNGDVEVWTSSSYPDYWRVSTVTATATTTAKYFKRGATSCKLSTASGYLYQDWAYNDDLKYLRGKTVTFRAMHSWCDTASCLRLAIYDGTTTSYSDYHSGNSAWSDDDDPMEVTATISDTATDISFRVYHTSAAGTSYIDDLRVAAGEYDKVYIGDLGLNLEWPHSVEYQQDGYENVEPWIRIHNYDIDTTNNYLLIPGGLQNYKLRIKGIGYCSFTITGASSELWTATIEIDYPQTLILSAEAVMYLYRQMILPNFTSGDREDFAKMLAVWENELTTRRMKFGMKPPLASVRWT